MNQGLFSVSENMFFVPENMFFVPENMFFVSENMFFVPENMFFVPFSPATKTQRHQGVSVILVSWCLGGLQMVGGRREMRPPEASTIEML